MHFVMINNCIIFVIIITFKIIYFIIIVMIRVKPHSYVTLNIHPYSRKCVELFPSDQ